MSESPFAPPSVEEQPPAFSPTPHNEIPLGPRIAGGVLVANAILSFAGMLTAPTEVPSGIFSGLIDAAIGVSLLSGKAQFLVWAKLRVVLGLLFFGATSLASGDYYLAIFQALISGALMGLLFGTPSPARIGVSSMACGLYMILGMIGLFGGSLPILNPYLGQLEDVPGGRIIRDDYQLAVPGDWKLRKREAAAKDNPDAEVWLVHASSDSHVIVIPERFGPDMAIDLATYQDNVVGNLRQLVSDLEVTRTVPSQGGVMISSHGMVDGFALDYIHRLYLSGGFGAQIVAFGPEGNLATDTQQIVDSFVYGSP